jgi:hypothetical protein
VRSSWTINNPVNAKLGPRLAHVLEETPPTVEQHGRQSDLELVHHTHVQVLLDHIRSTRDEYRRSLLKPSTLALVEHTLAHNVGTNALRGVAKHVIDPGRSLPLVRV